MWDGVGATRRLVRKTSFPIARSASVKSSEPVIWNEVEYSRDGLELLEVDPMLASHQGHLRYRYSQFLQKKRAIDQHEGGLERFSRGYERFGFTREGNTIMFREWIPAASCVQLVGDFNNWDGVRHQLERDQFGVWSITIPERDGRPAIAHGSRVKLRLCAGGGGGQWVDRIPAWITWATVEPGKMGAFYDGIYWDPPAHQKDEGFCGGRAGEKGYLKLREGVSHKLRVQRKTAVLTGFRVWGAGEKGYHKLWDSRCFNYGNWEVLRFLLSNLRWWMEEFQFDGFRFDGATSMLYHHHGINTSFSGNYEEYFSTSTDVDAVVYLMLANDLVHGLLPDATCIAEDVSGMPTLCRSVPEGGVGFDYRLAMGIPDRWIEYLKDKPDEAWSMHDIVHTMTNRRYSEKCIAFRAYSMVGDKSFAFLLMDSDMYFHMSALQEPTPKVERGIALHKFGHPEWIDFPREGNGWSYERCRRHVTFSTSNPLKGTPFMLKFDEAMNELDEKFQFLASSHQLVSSVSQEERRAQTIATVNVNLTALNPNPSAWQVGADVDHFSSPEGEPGKPETNFNNRCVSIQVLSPSRSCQVYYRVPEPGEEGWQCNGMA
eukprot:jgi/Mesen1/1543/ME001330S00501